jgi:hypothetical protein
MKARPPAQKAEETPECGLERQERIRQVFGLGDPYWNNFTQQWEGEGAAEMTEKEEVERLVLAEVRRRKTARAAAATPDPAAAPPDSPKL